MSMALDVVAWHDRTQSDHGTNLNVYAARGYRTLSLSLYGEPSDPRYASVMIKRNAVIAGEQHYGMTAAQFQEIFNSMAARGWGPYIATGTGPAEGALFAAVFTPSNPIPLSRYGLSRDQFAATNAQAKHDGLRLIWMDSYGTAEDTRYIGIWAPNPEKIAWACDGVDEALSQVQQRFDAMQFSWACPQHVAITPSGRETSFYADRMLKPFEARANLTSAEYQTLFDQQWQLGRRPLRVSAKGTGSAVRFAALFAEREEGEARNWSAVGPATVPAIDNAMRAFMTDHGIRGGALAVIDGTRLVYTQGYTLAEPDYPTVTPTTLFRQASCSKIFVAMAVYHLLQDRAAALRVSIDQLLDTTTLQSVLNLTEPNGSPPADARFSKITLRHMLESRSGLDQGLIWQSVAAANAFGGTLPASREQLAHYAAGSTMKGEPGDPNNSVYGNFDYFMLSEVVRTMVNEASFEAALGQLVCGPLAISRFRQSRSLPRDNAADEARYHLTVYNLDPIYGVTDDFLVTGNTSRDNSNATVAAQYGSFDNEMFAGAGGLSVAVTDMARLIASLSLHDSNPVLSAGTLESWMQSAVKATAAPSKPDHHGFYGWDWVGQQGSSYVGSKGGSLPGTGTSCVFTTGGISAVIAVNSHGRSGVQTDWQVPVLNAAAAHDWGAVDWFPHYNMPTFPAPRARALVKLPAVALQKREFSFMRVPVDK
jgi:CubicO group peptidase (beta-lactamase class C family)